jgi:succinoglycan biosynthesis transport protein ExoP
LDIKEHIGVLKRHRGLIMSFVVLAIIHIILITIKAPRFYESEAILRIKQPINISRTLLKINRNRNSLVINRKLSTYIQIMKSRAVIEKVIARIKWNGFQKKKSKSKNVKLKYQSFQKRFIITPIKGTELLKIKVRARQPKQAKIMVNTLVTVFIDRITALTRFEQRMTRKFIATRVKYSKKRMEKAESMMAAFKRKNQIIGPTIELVKYVERISAIDKRLAENAMEMAVAEARLDNAVRQVGKLKPEFIAENAMIESYQSKSADLELKLVELTQRYGAKHPEITACRAQIAELKNKLDLEIKRVITMDAASSNPIYQSLIKGKLQAETTIAVAAKRKIALDKVLIKEKARITNFTAQEQELIHLMRDVAVTQDIYMMLAQRFEEARIAEVMQPTDVQIVDKAVVSQQPVRINRWRRILIIFCGSLFWGIGIAYTWDYFHKFICTEADVKYYLDLPVLGRIPKSKCEDLNCVGKPTSW